MLLLLSIFFDQKCWNSPTTSIIQNFEWWSTIWSLRNISIWPFQLSLDSTSSPWPWSSTWCQRYSGYILNTSKSQISFLDSLSSCFFSPGVGKRSESFQLFFHCCLHSWGWNEGWGPGMWAIFKWQVIDNTFFIIQREIFFDVIFRISSKKF